MTKFRMSALSALVAVGVMGMAGAASAAVVGGGATLPEDLYNGTTGTNGILTSSVPGFAGYTGVGSGAGKRAFFNNDPAEINQPAGTTVDYAGSDSLVSQDEADLYELFSEPAYGQLIQVPSVLTSVTVPYNITGRSSVNLTSAQLAQVFADPAIVRWNQVAGFEGLPNNREIKVIYRTDDSGTTEIFLRHLNAVNSTLVPSVSNSFVSVIDVTSSKYVEAKGSNGVMRALAANPDAITYMSPDKVEYGNPAKVASINGLLPTEVNPQAVVDQISVPTGSQINNPLAWGIIQPKPREGYPIVGATNMIFSQCYASTSDRDQILSFIDWHYAGINATKITEHGFVQLPVQWRGAVRNTFGTGGTLQVGATNVCNGVPGRPL